MKEGYKLALDIWLEWRCKKCDARKEMIEGEEWQMHCGQTMDMQPVKQFKVLPQSSIKETG